jgi:hypothetical protein
MRTRFLFTIILFLFSIIIWSQGVPQGINYQAVARDIKGIPMANQEINLKISLLAGDAGGKTVYQETHAIQTGALGMFSLVIGKGQSLRGDFNQVPWSESEIWVEIAIDENNSGRYTPLSTSQLMAVPYALHAGSADEITDKAGSGRADLGPSAFWKVNGNNMTFPGFMFLGTIDCKDLVFKTNSISRMRITCTGIVDIGGNLFVGGTFNAAGITTFTNTTQSTNINNGAVIIDGGLGVEKNVNIGGNLCVDGVTNLKNTTQSNTKDDGSLVVEGGVGIEKNLNVGGNSTVTGNSTLGGTLDVTGATTLSSTLNVDGIATYNNTTQSTTKDNGSLIVEGGVGIEKNINVGGNSSVTGNSAVGGIATFNNTAQSTTKDDGAVVIEGGVGIEKNLNVGGNTEVDGTLGVDGITTLKNTTESSTKDNGSLVVEGGVGIEKNLNVGGNSAVTGNSTVGGTLGVTNAATFSSSVNVNGITTLANTTQSTTFNNGALIVDGGAGIEKNLNVGGNTEVDGTLGVDGVTTLRNNLNVSKDDGSFVATITNTNNNTGDGLKIRLGKTHPAWNGSAYLNATSPAQEFFAAQIALVRNWIDNPASFNTSQLITMSPNAHYAGTACNVLNLAFGGVNDIFDNLVLSFPPPGVGNIFGGNNGFQTIFSELDAALADAIPDALYANLNIPAIPFPSFTLPDIIPNIPSVSCSGLPTFSMPVLSFTNLPGSLTNANQFIMFEDKDGRSLGSIRAQAVGDWATNYLDGTYIAEVMASIVGIDLL